jgi:hypothetical protein
MLFTFLPIFSASLLGLCGGGGGGGCLKNSLHCHSPRSFSNSFICTYCCFQTLPLHSAISIWIWYCLLHNNLRLNLWKTIAFIRYTKTIH